MDEAKKTKLPKFEYTSEIIRVFANTFAKIRTASSSRGWGRTCGTIFNAFFKMERRLGSIKQSSGLARLQKALHTSTQRRYCRVHFICLRCGDRDVVDTDTRAEAVNGFFYADANLSLNVTVTFVS